MSEVLSDKLLGFYLYHKKLLSFSYLILVFLFSILPAGYFMGINLKIIFFTLFLSIFFTFFILNYSINYFFNYLSFITIFTFYLFIFLIWTLIGISNGFDNDSLSHFKVIIIVLVIVFINYLLYKEKVISFVSLVKAAVWGNITYCTIKIYLFIQLISGALTPEHLDDILEKLFSIKLLTINGVEDSFFRLHTICDALSPFLILFLLFNKRIGLKINPLLKFLLVFIMVVSSLVALSRYLMVITLFSLLSYIIIERKIKTLILIALSVFSFVVINFDEVSSTFEYRFTSDENSRSDQIRVLQTNYLLEEFYHSPIFGNGLGSYSKDYQRNEETRYSYEMLWLSYLSKFGLFGFTLFIILVFSMFYLILKDYVDYFTIIVSFFYFLWLLSGFTNPYFANSTASVLYMLFMTFSSHYKSLRNKNIKALTY